VWEIVGEREREREREKEIERERERWSQRERERFAVRERMVCRTCCTGSFRAASRIDSRRARR
jgi:hypothetical protein